MKIATFYDPRQTAPLEVDGHSTAQRPGLLARYWNSQDLPIVWQEFRAMTREEISLVHDPAYVSGILDGKIENGRGGQEREVADTLPWICGSMVAAALFALRTKAPAFSLSCEAHHAHYSLAEGYCSFNSLVLAAVMARRHGAFRVGICDLDQHYGNGTAHIIRTLNLDFISHYTFGRDRPSAGDDTRRWLDELPTLVRGSFSDCDLVIVNAGVDCSITDPQGGVFTDGDLIERDYKVFKTLTEMGVPFCVALAGGYEKDSAWTLMPVLRRHTNTLWQILRATGFGEG